MKYNMLFKKLFITAGLIPAFLCGLYASEINGPREPQVPDVSIQDPGYGREALIVFEGGTVRSFYIVFPEKDIILFNPGGGYKKSKNISLEDVRSLSVKKWKRISRNREMVFVPSDTEITMKDGTVFHADTSLDMIRKLRYRTDNKAGYLYTIFYDYWQKDRWINSGSKDPKYPEDHPVKGTVTGIRFDKAVQQPGLLDFLGKSLDKSMSR